MSKVCVFFATGYEELEALSVVDLLVRAKIDVDMVSVTDSLSVTSSHGVRVMMNKTLKDVDFTQVDMIVLPGGMPGTTNLEETDKLMEHVDDFVASERWVAAICAAPTILGHRGHLDGREACCYPGKEVQLTGAKISYEKVCVDGRIITSRGAGTALAFGLKIVEVIKGQKQAEALAESIVYV